MDVLVERVPLELRSPNTRFVAIVCGRELVRAEPIGQVWLAIQDRIRAVLNAHWDPIGVGERVQGEYDSYIADLHSMLARRATPDQLAEHLLRIETERMGLQPLPLDRRLEVAQRLRATELPSLA